MGLTYCPSHGNFVFADTTVAAKELEEGMLQRGVIIRPGDIWGYDTWARMTIGTMDQNEKLIAALEAVIQDGK